MAGQDLPRLYSAYSPDVSAQKGGSSSRVQTLGSDAVKPQPGGYLSNAGMSIPVTVASPSHGISKVGGGSYLPTYQSPDNQGLIQHLSAFESLSKDIRGDEVVPTLASGMKDYPIDLTLSPASKVYTPHKESSPIREEKPKASGVSPHKEELGGSYLLGGSQNLGYTAHHYGASYSAYMPGLASDMPYKSPTLETGNLDHKLYSASVDTTGLLNGQGFLYTTGSVDAHTSTSPLNIKLQPVSEYKGYLPVHNEKENENAGHSPSLLSGQMGNLQAKSYTYLKNTHDFTADKDLAEGLLDKKELKESIYVNEGKNSGVHHYEHHHHDESSPSKSYKDYESHGSPGSQRHERYVSQGSPQYDYEEDY